MRIELVPDPGVDAPLARAVAQALHSEGLADALLPSGYISVWRAAGLREATERDPHGRHDRLNTPETRATSAYAVELLRKRRGTTRA